MCLLVSKLSYLSGEDSFFNIEIHDFVSRINEFLLVKLHQSLSHDELRVRMFFCRENSHFENWMFPRTSKSHGIRLFFKSVSLATVASAQKAKFPRCQILTVHR